MTTMTAAQALEEAARIFERQLWPLTSGERDAVDHIRALASRLAEQEQNNAAGRVTETRLLVGEPASGEPAPAAPSAREVAEKCAEICEGTGPLGRDGWPTPLEGHECAKRIRAYAATLSSPRPKSAAQKVPDGWKQTVQDAINYIEHVGANWTMRGQPHPQQWILDNLHAMLAAAPSHNKEENEDD